MSMEMCRVCLSTKQQMIPLDETFIINYNLLTNLNITLLDGMPQYACQKCVALVKNFIDFREKAIITETRLREIINSDIKSENKKIVKDNENGEPELEGIKSEVKEENVDNIDEADNFDYDCNEYEHNEIIVKKEKDEKTKKIKKKKKNKLKVKAAKLLHSIANGLENKWFCGICPKIFDEKTELNNHLDSHNEDRKCDLCREQVNSLSQLLGHRIIHVPLKQSKCHICEKVYKTCFYLEHHYRNYHIEEDSKNLVCKLCPWSCDTPKKLSSHIQVKHSEIKFICDYCSKGFKTRTCLTSHIKSHIKIKSYFCDLCGFSCNYGSGLKSHKIRKHNPQRVCCKQCKAPFPSQADLDKHKCKKKLQICPVCGVQVNGTNRLSRHMVSHSDERSYKCTRCPSTYKTQWALKAHLNRHDGNRTKQCEYCPAKFYTDEVLLKHRRIHTGEKPYVCGVCKRGFTGRYNLKVHMKVHGEYLIVKKNNESDNFMKLYLTKSR